MSVLPLNIHLRELGFVNFLRYHNKKDMLFIFLKTIFSYKNFKDYNFDEALGNHTGPYAWGANTVYREARQCISNS